MDFNFTKYRTRRKLIDCISVNANNLNIGKVAYEKLGSPLYINVYYNTEKDVIKLEKGNEGDGRRGAMTGASVVLGSKNFCKYMKIGFYKPIGENIFELEK